MVKTVSDAVAMVEAICLLPGNRRAIQRQNRHIKASGLQQAIIGHDTAFLYGWLMEAFSLQGISNAGALTYIGAHGNAEWEELRSYLRTYPPECLKLKAFETFRKCGYRKLAHSCNVPELIGTCVVPLLPLRKGDLNQLALSLYLFIRDVCHGDLVSFLDETLASVTVENRDRIVEEGRRALVKAFNPIFGIGPKLVSMSLSWILIAAGRHRPEWVKVGRSMIVVDSLIHNFLHRSGILTAYRMPHAYGTACYSPRGCEAIIRDIAERVNLTTISPAGTAHSPRMVQLAIWRLCGESELGICNGRKIDDRTRCGLLVCPVRSHCSRKVLFTRKSISAKVPDAEAALLENQQTELKKGGDGASRGANGRRKRSPPEPLEQGDCDGLCGLYTVMNAIRLALHPLGRLSGAQEQALQLVLVQSAQANWSFSRMFAHGLSAAQLVRLMRIGVKFANDMTGKPLFYTDRQCRDVIRRRYGLKTALSRLTGKPNPIVIAGIAGRMSHWSIITGLTPHHIVFHDSDGTHRLALRHCRLGRRPRPKAKPRYWITLHGTLCLAESVDRHATEK